MSDTAVLEKKVVAKPVVSEKAPAIVAVMDQQPSTAIRAESPLYHAELDKLTVQRSTSGGVVFRELPLLGHLTLRGSQQNSSFMKGCAEVFGAPLPTKPLTTMNLGDFRITSYNVCYTKLLRFGW